MSEADRTRWDARHRERPLRTGPHPWLARSAVHLPHGGRVLDLAAGLGEDVSWLLDQGFDAHAIDVSPVAAARARARDPRLRYEVVDLDTWQPDEAWDGIVTEFFLDRSLWPRIRSALRPGGLFVAEVLTAGTGHGRAFHAERGELLRAFVDWHVLAWEEARTETRWVSRLAVQRPA